MATGSKKAKNNSEFASGEDTLLQSLTSSCGIGLLLSENGQLRLVSPLCASFLGLPEDTAANPERYRSVADVLKASAEAGALTEADLDLLLQQEQHLREKNTPFTQKIKVHARVLEIRGAVAAEGTTSFGFLDITEQEKQSDILHEALRETELVRAALNRLSQAVCIKNTDHQYVYVNDAYCRMHGLPQDDILGKTPFAFYEDKLATWIARSDEEVLNKRFVKEVLEIPPSGSGCPKFFSAFKTCIDVHGGGPLILTLLQNVTEEKQRENQLSKALQKAELSEQVLEQLKTPVIVRDDNHSVVMMNHAYADFFGVDRDRSIGGCAEDTLPKNHAEKSRAIEKDVFETGKMREVEDTFELSDGTSANLVIHKGLAQVQGKAQFLVTTVNDVTRFKRQEARLQEALEKTYLSELILEQLGIPVQVKDHDHRYVMTNNAYSECFGIPKEQMIGKTIDELFPPERAAAIRQSDRFVFNSGLAQEYELDFEPVRGGDSYPVIIKKTLARTDRSQEYLVTSFHDISRQKEKERQLRAALRKADLSAQVLDRLPYPVVVKDENLHYVMANDAFARLHGLTAGELIGKSMLEVLPSGFAEENREAVLTVLRTGEMREWEDSVRLADGRSVTLVSRDSYLHCNGEDYIVTTLNDVTQLRRQEDRIIDVLGKAELAEAVLDQLPTPIIVKDRAFRYVFVNEAFCRLRNLSRDQLIGMTVADMFSDEETNILSDYDTALLDTGRIQEVEHHVPLPGGQSMMSLTRKSLAKTKAGESYIVTVLNRIDEQKKQERRFLKVLGERQLSELVLDAIPTPVAARDGELRYALVNRAFSDLFSLNKDDVIGLTAAECLPPEIAATMDRDDREVLATGEPLHSERHADETEDGAISASICSKSIAVTESGDRYVVGVITDVSEMKRREIELRDAREAAEGQYKALMEVKFQAEYDSLHDDLTGLANRRHLDQHLRQWQKGSHDKELALLQIDLDRFKEINDTLGHAAGDFILQHVAAVLRHNCQDDDFIARIGGDEFIVVREANIAREELEFLADQLITELNKPVRYENDLCRFGASIGIDIGIASMRDSDADPSRLMMNADIALYRAKQEGRGRYTFFTRELQQEIERTKRISDDIVHGLEKGEFFPVYQPQFDAKTLRLIGVEALARWKHPVLGVLAPPAFLEAAKQLGATDRIDQAILEASLADMREWERKNTPVPRLAVNVSAQRIANPFLINLLKKLDIPAGKLAFELHESTMLDHTNADLRERIQEIADLGIDIEIDNFGTGQSSFLGMWSAAPKRLKIARELVLPVASSDEHRHLLQAVIDMGRAINLEVVSEGVETVQHIKILRQLGCDVLQGYALARPMSSAELMDFFQMNQQFALRG
jgi:diguanylate cyclase (GGDEF)-like protein/PAS domain S-box-containing protein